MTDAPPDPFARFGVLLERARATELPEPTAVCLATVGEGGRPSARMVLLKDFDRRGFVFYTNLGSRKARQIGAHAHAALCFHWQPLEVQVRVEGPVERVSDAEADVYFASRARGSRIGAWASRQSEPLAEREELEERVREMERRFPGNGVPRPPFWSGLRVVPERIEFWQGLPSRLHDREVYTPDGAGGWRTERLYP